MIDQLLREEYLRAKAHYEREGAEMTGDLNVDNMVELEETIRHEQACRDTQSTQNDAMDMD